MGNFLTPDAQQAPEPTEAEYRAAERVLAARAHRDNPDTAPAVVTELMQMLGRIPYRSAPRRHSRHDWGQ